MKVIDLVEQPDDSALVTLDMTDKEKQSLIQAGFISLLKEAIDKEEKPKVDNEGWISNVGNKDFDIPLGFTGCVKSTLVEVKFRDGAISTSIVKEYAWDCFVGCDCDITHYRILK